MRIAVFTNKYPAQVTTFFERDMRALLEAGNEIDIFPIYPVDDDMWSYAPGILDERILSRDRVHHLTLGESLRQARLWPPSRVSTIVKDAAALTAAATRFGATPLAKTAYVLPKAWAWAKLFPNTFDHVLAYWGNYAASCAYAFHRLSHSHVPFSIWLHAGTDLYFRPTFLRKKLLYADNILVCCEFNRSYIHERFPDIHSDIADRIQVCYHGLDISKFPYEPEGRSPRTILAVGRLSRFKGFDYLLRAVHELTRRGIEVELELVGDGKQEQALRNLARELQIADRVTFRGWLQFNDVQAAMRRATMLVHPSATLGDGLPNVLREAMALGTPVIASRVAGIPEALDEGRCGVLVAPKDVVALADAIARLLGDESMRYRNAALARKRTEDRFDIWRNGRQLADRLASTRRLAGPAAIAEAAS